MSDLIDRQAAIEALHTWFRNGFDEDRWWNSTYVLAAIEGLPPAQPERIRGRWTRDNACSECGCQPWFSGDIHNYNFCPNCGADMREVTNYK